MATAEPRELVELLLAWYDRARRGSPWRTAAQDPYRTWVSEIMLQQTRVEVVKEYFPRFLARFPSLEALAEAPVEDVLALWSGLGYYRRARMLHAGARAVRDRHGGRVPDARDALEEVPGIGRYTAGAILSIAYGLPEPLVDGNVERVLTRAYALPGDPRKAPLARRLWELAGRLVPRDRPGDFNQALMELGATVCTPRSPACPTCPWKAVCAAHAAGEPARYPETPAPAKAVSVRMAALVASDRAGRILMLRRAADEGLMAGLWELPGLELGEGEDPRARLRELVRDRTGLAIAPGDELGQVRHGIMNRRITIVAFAARLGRGRVAGPDWERVPPAGLPGRGVSSMVKKVLGLRPSTAR